MCEENGSDSDSNFFHSRASAAELRARYIALAKKHHPDRFASSGEKERRRHEKIFQRVTLAYDSAINNSKRCYDDSSDSDSDSNSKYHERWREIWERFASSNINLKELSSILKNTFQDVANVAVAAAATAAATAACNVMQKRTTIEVPLEDIHNRVKRRVRIWTRDKPTIHEVDCGWMIHDEAIHCLDGFIVEIVARPHPVFHRNELLGKMDLYCTQRITLASYLFGEEFTIRHLDGRTIKFKIEPFQDISLPIVLEKEGLQRQDNLYIRLELSLPKNLDSIEPHLYAPLQSWLRLAAEPT